MEFTDFRDAVEPIILEEEASEHRGVLQVARRRGFCRDTQFRVAQPSDAAAILALNTVNPQLKTVDAYETAIRSKNEFFIIAERRAHPTTPAGRQQYPEDPPNWAIEERNDLVPVAFINYYFMWFTGTRSAVSAAQAQGTTMRPRRVIYVATLEAAKQSNQTTPTTQSSQSSSVGEAGGDGGDGGEGGDESGPPSKKSKQNGGTSNSSSSSSSDRRSGGGGGGDGGAGGDGDSDDGGDIDRDNRWKDLAANRSVFSERRTGVVLFCLAMRHAQESGIEVAYCDSTRGAMGFYEAVFGMRHHVPRPDHKYVDAMRAGR